MNLKSLPFPVYGDASFRGKCPTESIEQITFFNMLRTDYPDTWGRIAVHVRNEQQLKGAQHRGIIRQKAEGMTKGASDVLIPARVSFVCELKRQDHTQCKWQEGQIEYLTACKGAGAFSCVALGWVGAKMAFNDWLAVLKGAKG